MKKACQESRTHKTRGESVYIVQCADGTLYTGWTTDLEARMNAHNKGEGAKYTRGRGPVQLVYSECWEDRGQALRREHQIKKLKRADKWKLINGS